MPFIDIQGEIPTGLSLFDTYQCYNILDSAVTAQLLPVMSTKLNDNHWTTYRREMYRVLPMCLEMSTKGFPIDQMALAELLFALEKAEAKALDRLHQFCDALDAKHINPRSPKDVQELFYTHLGLPPIYSFDRATKQRKISTDIKALEKLRVNYPVAMPLVNAIISVRESSKMGSVFKRGLEPEGRNLRCQFSPTGTETGRLSSQQNPYGRGTNAQNLTDRVRQAIAAPDGYAILNLDLKSGESYAVGYISRCQSYIDACVSGDLHTAVTRMTWPRMAWTGDLAKDKALAEQPGYRHFSWRDMAKREGHGSNYYGKARTIAMELSVPTQLVQDFQDAYFAAFPEIQEWHLETIAKIQRDGVIVTQLGRERRFWGRPDDAATWREAIAFNPQSLVGDAMNEGLVQVLDWLRRECRDAATFLGRDGKLIPFTLDTIDIRAQVHDAGVFILPLEALDTLAPLIQDRMEFPVDFGSQGIMRIPSELMLGRRWNKAKGADRYMREGLKAWTPGQPLHWL